MVSRKAQFGAGSCQDCVVCGGGGALRIKLIQKLEQTRDQAKSFEETAQHVANVPPAPPPLSQQQQHPMLAPGVENQSSLESLQEQQEYVRAFLRQNPPVGQNTMQQSDGLPLTDDPMMKLVQSLLGAAGAGVGPGAAPGIPAEGSASDTAPPAFSLADVAAALGLPPFATRILRAVTQSAGGGGPDWRLKMAHTVFAVVLAVYVLVLVGSSVAMYGSPPPAPATAQTPWVVFLTGELVLGGSMVALQRRGDGLGGLGMGIQFVRDVVQDGSLVLFFFGLAYWWKQGWQQT